jgi:hypothetical protein
MIVYHPFTSLGIYEKVFKLSSDELQQCYGIVNDLHYTAAITSYPPHIISLTAVFISYSLTGRTFPDDLNVDFKDVIVCTQMLLGLYSKWKLSMERL